MANYGSTSVGGGAQGALSGAMAGAQAGAAFGPWGIGIGALAGGIFGGQSTSVPKPPSYEKLMQNTLKAQRSIQGPLLDLEGQYRPQWQKLNETTYNQQMFGGNGTTGYLDLMNRAQAGMQGYEQNAVRGQLASTQYLMPYAKQALMSPYQQAMQDTLNMNSMRDLQAGRGLTPEDERYAQQVARSGMTARGLGGRQAIAAEVLQSNALGRDRYNDSLNNAYKAMIGETAFQNQALQAAQSGKDLITGTGKFMLSSDVLGNADPRVFSPENKMAADTANAEYQHGMGVANMNMNANTSFINSLGAFGKFAAANPNAFNFNTTPNDTSAMNTQGGNSAMMNAQMSMFNNFGLGAGNVDNSMYGGTFGNYGGNAYGNSYFTGR